MCFVFLFGGATILDKITLSQYLPVFNESVLNETFIFNIL